MTHVAGIEPAIPHTATDILRSVGAAVGVAVLADWLFYMHGVGISLAIFLVALCAAMPLTNTIQAQPPKLIAALAIFVVALLPLIEQLSAISAAFAIVGTALFALLATGRLSEHGSDRVMDLGWMILSGPFQFIADCKRVWQSGIGERRASWLVAWILPITISGIFILQLELSRLSACALIADPLRSPFGPGKARQWKQFRDRVSIGLKGLLAPVAISLHFQPQIVTRSCPECQNPGIRGEQPWRTASSWSTTIPISGT